MKLRSPEAIQELEALRQFLDRRGGQGRLTMTMVRQNAQDFWLPPQALQSRLLSAQS